MVMNSQVNTLVNTEFTRQFVTFTQKLATYNIWSKNVPLWLVISFWQPTLRKELIKLDKTGANNMKLLMMQL